MVTHSTLKKRAPTLVGLGLGKLVLTGCESPPERTVSVDYRAFTTEPREVDVPDAELQDPLLVDLEDEYFRLVGRYSSTVFHAALINNHDGDSEDESNQGLCLIAVDSDRQAVTSHCESPSDPENPTIRLTADDERGPLEVFLVPDEFDLEAPEGWSRSNTNIVVIDNPGSAPNEVTGTLPGLGIWNDSNVTLQRPSDRDD